MLREATCCEGPQGIAEPPHQREQNAELEDLQGDMGASRFDKLRQECQKEERGLRTQDVDGASLAKPASEPALASRGLDESRVAISQRADSQVNQVCRTNVLHEHERSCRRRQQCGQPKCCRRY